MDAKAKVVAIQRWECRPLNWEVQYQQRDDGEWVKFTDHEAALAELREENSQLLSAMLAESSRRGFYADKYQTLLTGLEALAGRMEFTAKSVSGVPDRYYAGLQDAYADAIKSIRTLASAGLEGNRNSATNDGERNGL